MAGAGDNAVIQHADLEYEPADVPRLIEPIERGVADVAAATRTIARMHESRPWSLT